MSDRHEHPFLRDERWAKRTIFAATFAVVAHVALLVASTRHRPRPPVVEDHALELAIDAVDLDLGHVEPPPDTPPIVEPPPAPTEQAGATRDIARNALATNERPPAPTAPSPISSAEIIQAPASAAPALTIVAPGPVTGIVGGPNPFLAQGGMPDSARASAEPMDPSRTARPEAKTAAEAKQAVEQSMKTALREADAQKGLGPEGPVVRALIDATYGSLAPERGDAIFVASVDANGAVTDLRLVSAKGDEQGWNDARAHALRGLSGKKIALRGAKGAEIRVAITSDIKLPSGTATGGTLGSALNGKFDVTDAVGKARRVVHGRLLSATMF